MNTTAPATEQPAARPAEITGDEATRRLAEMMRPALVADTAEIIRALQLLMAPGQVTELRALDVHRKYGAPCTVSGYFDLDHAADLARDAADIGKAKGVYIVLNPVTPALQARSYNRARACGKGDPTTTDNDIAARRWLPIDLDATRPAGISSSASELAAAEARALAIRDHLSAQGWPAPIMACSGNGFHLLYRVDLPTDDGEMVHRCLQALAARFDDAAVTVDQTVFNPARIWKLYGTVAAKGDSTSDRPHRLSRLIDVPVEMVPVSLDLLAALAGEAEDIPPTKDSSTKARNGADSRDNRDPVAKSRAWLENWLAANTPEGIEVSGPNPWQGSGLIWTMDPCPWTAEHTGKCACITIAPDGKIGAMCQHNTCEGKGWADLRALWEPEHLERHRTRTAAGNWANPVLAARAGDPVPCTDLGNAERFAYYAGGRLRFDVAVGTWRVWDGRRWAGDNGAAEATQLAMQTARKIQEEAHAAPPPDNKDCPDLRKMLFAHAMASEARGKLEAMLALACKLRGITTAAEAFDADPLALNCRNGTLDLRTGTLQPHNPDDLITKLAPVDYDPAVRGNGAWQLWERFLATSTQGDAALVAFLQRATGYSLTGDVSEEVLFFIHGPENTGKSTFVEAIKGMMGDYACTADFSMLVKKQNGDGGPRNDLARLAGKRFVSSSEVQDGKSLAEDVVKAITGNEKISARFLYREYFDFQPAFKLWLAANHAPKVDADDGAMWRRILRIPFEHIVPKAERDPKVKATLRDLAKAGPVILLWAMEGLRDWQLNRLGVPAAVETATQAYRDQCDPLADFFADICTFATGVWIGSSELYLAYQHWATASNIRERFQCSQKTLAKKLHDRGCTSDKISAGWRIWRGITIADNPSFQAQSGACGACGSNSIKSPNLASHGEVYQSAATSATIRHNTPEKQGHKLAWSATIGPGMLTPSEPANVTEAEEF